MIKEWTATWPFGVGIYTELGGSDGSRWQLLRKGLRARGVRGCNTPVVACNLCMMMHQGLLCAYILHTAVCC